MSALIRADTDTYLSLLFRQLEGGPELLEAVAPQHGRHEGSIGLEHPLDLLHGLREVVHPVQAQVAGQKHA